MNTTKALTDEQIAEVRERYANGELQKALADEYHVSQRTISNYVKQGAKPTAKPDESDILDFIYNVARGFETFAHKHLCGDFSIRVTKDREYTIITAVCGDKEITIKSAVGKETKT